MSLPYHTDHTQGKCITEIAEHSHYVQGVAWDPLNEFIATQSSDRSMHIYSITQKDGTLELHAVGKNTRMNHRHSRTPSSRSRPPMLRRDSTTSETESNYTNFFRRLTFSPDGGLLATPAGQFEDPSVNLASSKTKNGKDDETPSRGRRGNPSAASNNSNQASTSTVYIYSRANFANQPIFHLPGHKKPSIAVKFSPILYELPFTASLLALSYRMLYAVATMDTVIIYDTQQAGPVCLLTKLHYDEFTDMTWSPDGQCLMLSSRDGYCTIVVFDEIFPTHHTQQQTLQLQSIAHHHSLPLTSTSTVATPMSTPSVQSTALPATPAMTPVVPGKRKAEVEPPLTPAPSVDESALGLHDADEAAEVPERVLERPKKKRRAALTHIGDVGS
ncbi:hypothetical protein IEO21_06731 [Rhodonia placenta]|uniref:CAF1B/HIR1 beta-propeller domain-containing protein n=1 Tax=Rhodonia placenta TaxID=104341 RepID=A0A8H7NZS7_9APHY|nr:hypothetical protein IEO21_06731 [Postia placenta]